MNKLLTAITALLLLTPTSRIPAIPFEQTASQQVQQEPAFPFPAIPSQITDPQSRAAYLLTHYWERVDFHKNPLNSETPWMEQGFVDFLSLFSYASDEVLQKAIHNLTVSALVHPSRMDSMVELVENYLYHPNSPMMNETYYRLFVQEFLTVKGTSSAIREKLRFQLASLNQNRVGTQAADFSYIDLKGTTRHLSEEKGVQTLVLFYDADCEECRHVLGDMKFSAFLSAQLHSGKLRVLAICIEGEEDIWRHMTEDFPSLWKNGRIDDYISLSRNYTFRAMPTLFLLDDKQNVRCKAISWQRLEDVWNR